VRPGPGSVENAVTLPVYAATNAALTMVTVQYARALPGILVNAADRLHRQRLQQPPRHAGRDRTH
jgi:NAD(P)H-dependent FMN reductase